MAALGVALVNTAANLADLGQLGQGHVHQREQIKWTRRGYMLDSQALCLDALDHAKEEIKSHYDVYAVKIDTFLVVLALIWPFALNTIQYSDLFVPQTPEQCDDCVEVQHPGLIRLWVLLMGTILVLPFWGILMLIRSRIRLHSWLDCALARLHEERCETMDCSPVARGSLDENDPTSPVASGTSKEAATAKLVTGLVRTVLQYQTELAEIWNNDIGKLVEHATTMFWISVTGGLLLTGLSMWIFLWNMGGVHRETSWMLAVIIVVGIVAPIIYWLRQCWQDSLPLTPDGATKVWRKSAEAQMLAGFAIDSPTVPEISAPQVRRTLCNAVLTHRDNGSFSHTRDLSDNGSSLPRRARSTSKASDLPKPRSNSDKGEDEDDRRTASRRRANSELLYGNGVKQNGHNGHHVEAASPSRSYLDIFRLPFCQRRREYSDEFGLDKPFLFSDSHPTVVNGAHKIQGRVSRATTAPI